MLQGAGRSMYLRMAETVEREGAVVEKKSLYVEQEHHQEGSKEGLAASRRGIRGAVANMGELFHEK